jgi:hypothetical protein
MLRVDGLTDGTNVFTPEGPGTAGRDGSIRIGPASGRRSLTHV